MKYADKVNPANRYLAYHFFLNSLFGIAHWATVVSDSDSLRAIFLIHYFPIYLLNTPFLYFYVRALLTNKIHIKDWDYLHFIPFLVILINILPYSLLPWALKLNFAYQLHRNFNHIYEVYFPLVPFAVYFVFRSIFSLLYISRSALLVWDSMFKGDLITNQTLKSWLWVCLGLGAVFNLALISFSFYSLLNNDFVLTIDEQGRGRTLATVLMSALTISIYFFPKVLYGFQFNSGDSFKDIIKLNEEITKKSKTLELSNVRLNQVHQLVQAYIKDKRFLIPGFAMSDLVKDISTPEHVLTYYFNNYKGSTFLKWKNQLRIKEAIKLLNAGDANSHTLESVGKACGYKSRSNFIQAFKSQTGVSPSTYLKKLS
ncbi:helix-turn-helix domain-containing protein [Aquirufa lenticrescens]